MSRKDRVISAKVTSPEYDLCLLLAKKLHEVGVLKQPTLSALLQAILSTTLQQFNQILEPGTTLTGAGPMYDKSGTTKVSEYHEVGTRIL